MAVQQTAKQLAEQLAANVQLVILGKDRAVEYAILGLMCQGHILIEDIPGVGKTMLAKSLARSTRCFFKRIQFTPDLLPSDITGVSIYNQKTGDFEFREGPIMAQIILADEINRATPKTQSALLECMEEHQVTVEGVTYPMMRPFLVLATQNPIEYEGTFPLPEAQLDRFLLRITIGYPSFADEVSIIDSQRQTHPIETLQPVMGADEVIQLQNDVKNIYVDDVIKAYIVSIVEATRTHPDVALGASPRASLGLYRCSQALALLRGRDYVLPDEVKELAEPVMAHRIITSAGARMRGTGGGQVVASVVEQVPVPGMHTRG